MNYVQEAFDCWWADRNNGDESAGREKEKSLWTLAGTKEMEANGTGKKSGG